MAQDTKKAHAGLHHVEDEYGFWDTRLEAYEKGASVHEEGPDWDDLYTTVCTPTLDTPSRVAPKEHIEVEHEPFVAEFSLGGGNSSGVGQVAPEKGPQPVSTPVLMMSSDCSGPVVVPGAGKARKRGTLKK